MTETYDYAIMYIQRYPKTVQGLRGHLLYKGFPQEDVEETLQRLQEQNYLNDALFCELYLASEVAKKGKPVLVIQQKLIQKGADKHLVQEVIDGLVEELEEGMKKKLRRLYESYNDDKAYMQAMTRRGYGFQLVRDVLRDLQEPEDS